MYSSTHQAFVIERALGHDTSRSDHPNLMYCNGPMCVDPTMNEFVLSNPKCQNTNVKKKQDRFFGQRSVKWLEPQKSGSVIKNNNCA
jgi:hypothetical protein